MTDIHLMCAADLHLGRHVSSKEAAQPESVVIEAWKNLIDACLQATPALDALLLAGDLIDKDGLFLPMRGVFRQGIIKLLDQGIFVFAIAGNHDPAVLRQMEQAVGRPEFCVLGKDGCWERKSLAIRGRVLHIDALSFTETAMKKNPLESRTWEPVSPKEVLIGLLHCDVDVPESFYAPVRASDFRGLPHLAWILGHIHIPQEIQAENPWVQYCGSLQGLDVSESGARGAWHLIIESQGNLAKKFVPLAPLQWQKITLDLSDLVLQDWENQIVQKIEEAIVKAVGKNSSASEIGVRLQLEGRTPLFRTLRQNLSKLQELREKISVGENLIAYFIESVIDKTRPELDLETLCQGSDMIAAFARKVKQIQESQKLSEEIVQWIEEKLSRDPFLKQCKKAWPTIAEYREIALHEGFQWLDQLLEQKQGKR